MHTTIALDILMHIHLTVRWAAARGLLTANWLSPNCLLLELLECERASVRCTAVRSLRNHLQHAPCDEERIALCGMVRLLDDTSVSGFSKPSGVVSFVVPVHGSEQLPSVRAEALLTLTLLLRCDFGFDQDAWTVAIEEKYGPAETATLPQEHSAIGGGQRIADSSAR